MPINILGKREPKDVYPFFFCINYREDKDVKRRYQYLVIILSMNCRDAGREFAHSISDSNPFIVPEVSGCDLVFIDYTPDFYNLMQISGRYECEMVMLIFNINEALKETAWGRSYIVDHGCSKATDMPCQISLGMDIRNAIRRESEG